MEAWLGLIGALAGTAIGGLVTYKVANQQHVHERRTEKERRLIAAYESIHDLLTTIAGQASTLNLGVLGAVGFNSPIKGDLLKEKIQLDRLRMLTDFYAPTLASDVKAISDQFAIVSRAVGETMLQKQHTDEWRSKMAETAALASAELTNLVQSAQKKLADLARSVVAS
ncbi:hypothetical protein [Pseudoxanthomonas yeongjuensis]|uniref:hypothetical protein n=1 Tax=Pseudoxanthomonas yeongjuensis TaxID=377616 RepID=UPI001390D575|nr:hypothetical protein [Pseudoxanthomonas yeongjuensis]